MNPTYLLGSKDTNERKEKEKEIKGEDKGRRKGKEGKGRGRGKPATSFASSTTFEPASATDMYVCLRLFAADLHFSAVIRGDDGKKFRCKISNPYINVDVKSSVDSIVRIESPPGNYS